MLLVIWIAIISLYLFAIFYSIYNHHLIVTFLILLLFIAISLKPLIRSIVTMKNRRVLEALAVEISNSLQKKEIVIFCGAGISKDSGLPLANELKAFIILIFQVVTEKFTKNKIAYDTDDPFEIFMDHLSSVMKISKILDLYEAGEPNTNHILIAKLAKNGFLNTICTTNFDVLIERALQREGLRKDKDFIVYRNEAEFDKLDFQRLDDSVVKVLKIHGSADDRKSIRTSLRHVAARRLSDKRKKVIDNIFANGKHNKVMIFGYSCSDEFDISPFIRQLKENQKEIILIDHCESDEIRIQNINKNPFVGFPGRKIDCNTKYLIKYIWHSFNEKREFSAYRFIQHDPLWREYVMDCFSEPEYAGWGDTFEWLSQEELYSSEEFNCLPQGEPCSVKHNSFGIERNKLRQLVSEILREEELFKDFMEIVEIQEDMLESARSIRKKDIEIYTNMELADMYFDIGLFEIAIAYLKDALSISQEAGLKEREALLYGALGENYENLGNFTKAEECFNIALDIVRSIQIKMLDKRFLLGLGHVYFSSEQYSKALDFYHKSSRGPLYIYETTCYIGQGNALFGIGDYNSALRYHEKALELMNSKGHLVFLPIPLIGIGSSYCGLGDYMKAIEYYEEALEKVRGSWHKRLEPLIFTGLGNAYYLVENEKNAIEYFGKAKKIFANRNQSHHAMKIDNNLSIINKKGEFEEFWKSFLPNYILGEIFLLA